jgi:hypothetical protein
LFLRKSGVQATAEDFSNIRIIVAAIDDAATFFRREASETAPLGNGVVVIAKERSTAFLRGVTQTTTTLNDVVEIRARIRRNRHKDGLFGTDQIGIGNTIDPLQFIDIASCTAGDACQRVSPLNHISDPAIGLTRLTVSGVSAAILRVRRDYK